MVVDLVLDYHRLVASVLRYVESVPYVLRCFQNIMSSTAAISAQRPLEQEVVVIVLLLLLEVCNMIYFGQNMLNVCVVFLLLYSTLLSVW